MEPIRFSFKDLREQRGLSLKQAGTLLSMDHTLLNRIENHVRRPTREQLMKLAELYQLDSDTLLVELMSDKLVRELKGERLAR
ncbi:helix-turn-helix domain-containing protein [Salmonirosea aquatica]|uniref:Helix-turn-helix domain-containing protein n=1 Tax=Salmonirosea aquatica TaxID=2654236 RepID=A0A7C9FC64_9BACT|nr:helix-turn-helix domain-containing protein [Cytophagaceae bacterium SJW1-29]